MNKLIYRRIKAYKQICRLAEVPQILIDHPELILSVDPSNEDLSWAYDAIKKYESEFNQWLA